MTSARSETYAERTHDFRVHIDHALDNYTQFSDNCPTRLKDAIRHSLLAPCKRLRPILTFMAAEACGADWHAATAAACGVEMVHTYSLIHDDLPAMDDDDLRRGRSSCHAMFGEAVAILAGDALLALALEVVARDTQPPEVAAHCVACLAGASGATALVGGQVDDLAATGQAADLGALESIHRRKTGAMICAALRLGGLVAQASAAQLSALDTYGCQLGLAFQIVDDLLDLHGDPGTLGKHIGKDAVQGKLTFPAFMGEAASRRHAAELIDGACTALSVLAPRTGDLEALARFVIERSR